MLTRWIMVAAPLLIAAAPAAAQFTAVVTPPRPPEPAAQVVAAGEVVRDTSAQARMQDLRAWVDSAAVSVGARRTTDTVVAPAPADTAPTPAPAAPQPGATEFREGAPAPDTATLLPLMALLGSLSLAGGIFLRRR